MKTSGRRPSYLAVLLRVSTSAQDEATDDETEPDIHASRVPPDPDIQVVRAYKCYGEARKACVPAYDLTFLIRSQLVRQGVEPHPGPELTVGEWCRGKPSLAAFANELDENNITWETLQSYDAARPSQLVEEMDELLGREMPKLAARSLISQAKAVVAARVSAHEAVRRQSVGPGAILGSCTDFSPPVVVLCVGPAHI